METLRLHGLSMDFAVESSLPAPNSWLNYVDLGDRNVWPVIIVYMFVSIYIYIYIALWLFNIAMENGLFIDGLPIKNGDFPWLC